jgi:hypothetical protein
MGRLVTQLKLKADCDKIVNKPSCWSTDYKTADCCRDKGYLQPAPKTNSFKAREKTWTQNVVCQKKEVKLNQSDLRVFKMEKKTTECMGCCWGTRACCGRNDQCPEWPQGNAVLFTQGKGLPSDQGSFHHCPKNPVVVVAGYILYGLSGLYHKLPDSYIGHTGHATDVHQVAIGTRTF